MGHKRHFAPRKKASLFAPEHREVGHRPADWGVVGVVQPTVYSFAFGGFLIANNVDGKVVITFLN
jgi:hypothetical protein